MSQYRARNLTEQISRRFAETTNIIAMIVLVFFGVLLGFIFYKVYSFDNLEEGSGGKIWFDLFKEGFLLLGGALTTLIGFYFGSRNSELIARVDKAREKVEQEKKEVDSMAQRMEEEAPNTSESAEDITPIQL